jgi:NTP pyrophosphatase (non-canonical NTP hydrolase)
MKRDKKLTETLVILMEECAEVTQAASKILRFGKDSVHPDDNIPNRDKLVAEIGDLLAIIKILVYHGVFSEDELVTKAEEKMVRLEKWSTIFKE